MRNLSILLFILFSIVSISSINAQDTDGDDAPDKFLVDVKKAPDKYVVVDVMPKYPGGEKRMYKFLAKKIEYPKLAKRNGIAGKVYVRFIVDESGDVTDAHVVRGIGGGCEEEALRVVNMMPKWKPAMSDGKAVKVQYTIPILFSLK